MAEMSMVEKVANAIAVADLNISAKSLPDVPMETMAEYVRLAVEGGHYQAMARAAIEAMREPTEEMRMAAGDGPNTSARVYQAMIDAALNGKEGLG